jgi:hypothetical protein
LAQRRYTPEGDGWSFDTLVPNAYTDNVSNESEYVFWIVSSVGIAYNFLLLIASHLILTNDPFQRATVAYSIVEGLAGNLRERQPVIDLKRLPITTQAGGRRRSMETAT